MTDRNLADLHPDLRPLCEKFIDACINHGLGEPVITQKWRSTLEQAKIWASGRTRPGPILTRSAPGTSKHEHTLNGQPASLAFDFLLKNKSGNIIKDGTDPAYASAGCLGKTLGLDWGGDFKHPDYDHFEIPNPDDTVST